MKSVFKQVLMGLIIAAISAALAVTVFQAVLNHQIGK